MTLLAKTSLAKTYDGVSAQSADRRLAAVSCSRSTKMSSLDQRVPALRSRRPRPRQVRALSFTPASTLWRCEGRTTLVMPQVRDGPGHLHRDHDDPRQRGTRRRLFEGSAPAHAPGRQILRQPGLRPASLLLIPRSGRWKGLRSAGASARAMLVASRRRAMASRAGKLHRRQWRSDPTPTAACQKRLWRAGRGRQRSGALRMCPVETPAIRSDRREAG